MKNYQVLLYYKYVSISDPESLKQTQIDLCTRLNLKGRILIAKEGINGTVEGSIEDTEAYVKEMLANPLFKGMDFKRSVGNGNGFPKLKIKVRNEIVSLGLGEEDFDPNEYTGKYLSAEELHQWFESGKEFYIVDMRNDYEFKVGYFENSMLPELYNFRDLPDILPEIEHLRNKTVVTVCTGGIRCEKASGFLVRKGFADVYQLKNGIHTYMEKYPNQHFKGKLYVFDGRVTVGFNVESPEHEIVGRCEKCGRPADNYIDCGYIHCKGHRHFIACSECLDDNGKTYCSQECNEKDSGTK